MRHISLFERIKFAQSARRHHIGAAHAMHVISTYPPILIERPMDGDEQWTWVGPDDRGLELEIVGVVPEPTTLLVIHVMPYAFRRKL